MTAKTTNMSEFFRTLNTGPLFLLFVYQYYDHSLPVTRSICWSLPPPYESKLTANFLDSWLKYSFCHVLDRIEIFQHHHIVATWDIAAIRRPGVSFCVILDSWRPGEPLSVDFCLLGLCVISAKRYHAAWETARSPGQTLRPIKLSRRQSRPLNLDCKTM